ncbi:MetQ/NlpA family ABC transporter substrate-binding protein [Dolosicoccus paucivorans]|uniref:Lipoprotein n=1 Tax=Dolosicoccus paucivorans TaxID=84521 RepID=A0A2N6SPQ2_9LACT|nr:MetQ/NlpA family ABC transporter substrate-binding protein [Dolosicoccus paucivorans]PMB84432.1 methionine ABC transporter substrate-binding protein [Dolosicoccus paucivorans]PMC59039.1 methionine ABC transporter substrate-binding protein [Dolosicoccus paucivorans]
MKSFIKRAVSGLLLMSLLLQFLSPLALAEDKPFDGETVKVGIMAGVTEEIWQIVVDKAKEEGINVELVTFTDYVQPNAALQDGSLDLNAFQHIAFLNDWNEANNGDIVSLGYTFVSPMGLYSNKYNDISELPDGATIAIPNDPINCERATLATEIAELIKVDRKEGSLATPDDITDNPKNLKFEELDAAQLSIALEDVDAAFINMDFATDAGLKLDDAIFVDAMEPEKLNEAYKNIIASRAEDKDNKLYQHIVELYQTEEVAKAISDTTNGADRAIWENAPSVN